MFHVLLLQSYLHQDSITRAGGVHGTAETEKETQGSVHYNGRPSAKTPVKCEPWPVARQPCPDAMADCCNVIEVWLE